MATEVIEHFLDGLNLLVHPTKLKNTELQTLENMEVRPTSVSDTLTYLALTSRSSYKRLHTDNLDFIAKNLIEFVKVAKSYGQRTGVSYGAWRAVGVPAAVLAAAGITRAG